MKKMPKNWNDRASYQGYFRSFGPLTLEVWYSCVSQTFNATIHLGGNQVAEVFRDYKADPMTDDDYNSGVLKHAEKEAKRIIREWSK